MDTPSQHRHIRSFVLRRGHITQAQIQAHERLMPQWSLPFQHGHLELAAAFGREAPTVLEIGFGMGETTATMAAADPGTNYLGCEVFAAGVGALLRRIEQQQLSNIRIIQHDVVEVLQQMLPASSLAGIHVFFPDPWPKKRHHKRRLIQPDFVQLLASRLRPEGYLHLATDWEPYAEQMLAVLQGQSTLQNTSEGYAPKPARRPLTKFENRGLKLGYKVHDLLWVKPSADLAASVDPQADQSTSPV